MAEITPNDFMNCKGKFELTPELKDFINHDDRYRGFCWLHEPQKFKDFFRGNNIDVVQVHTCEPVYNDKNEIIAIVGFCGIFKWHRNILTPLDGDSYSDETLVYGFNFFGDEETRLDILVGNDW